MAIHVALFLSLVGSLGLAGVLAAWADRVAGARMLVLFLLGVSFWIVGNELPTWAGPEWDRVGLSLMAVAPLASAASGSPPSVSPTASTQVPARPGAALLP